MGSVKSILIPPDILYASSEVIKEHIWVLSALSAHSDIGLTSMSDYSDIELKGSQSNVISDIGLTFPISDIWFLW
jgi:hypothetical protein